MKYTATFSNGVVAKRGSERTYAAAWIVIVTYLRDATFQDRNSYCTGFAKTRELAEKAAASKVAEFHTANRKYGGNFTNMRAEVVDTVVVS